MGKSPSSLKKKRSKISSQARIKKKSKSRTRRNKKYKKLRRRNDSVSYSSDSDDSRSSVSTSSTSSEDDYRRKRSRSRTRKDVKGNKKRARRQSSSRESIEDAPRVKKRKGSKKNDDVRVRKKNPEKKKKNSKRVVNVSSTSSGSWGGSSGSDESEAFSKKSDESEVEKRRSRSERGNKDRRRLEKVKNGSKQERSSSRSCSSCVPYNEYSDCRSEDKLIGRSNSRRLRSVITVIREEKEDEGMDDDVHKEEMVYDHDDYPSSRSNDSIDGGSKRVLVHNPYVSPKKGHAEDGKGEAVVSNIRTGKVIESDKYNTGHAGSNPSCDGVGMNDDVLEKKNKDSDGTDGMNAYDLESVLREKALENLRMFRMGNQTDAKVPVNKKDLIGSDAETLPTVKSQLSQNRSPIGVGARVVGGSQVAKEKSLLADLSQNNENVSKRNNRGKEIRSTKLDVAHPPEQLSLAGNLSELVSTTVTTESNESVVLEPKQESLSTGTIKKHLPALLQPPQAKFMIRNNVDTGMVENAETVNPPSSNSNGDKVNNISTLDDPSSCTKSPSAGTGSNKPQDEASEGSQFQQKTMTVMRGGEMVEVSYKVYIPKKAPALARRPLKR